LSTLTVILFPSSSTTTRAFLTSCRSIEKLRSNQYIAFVLISKELGVGLPRFGWSVLNRGLNLDLSEPDLWSSPRFNNYPEPDRMRSAHDLISGTLQMRAATGLCCPRTTLGMPLLTALAPGVDPSSLSPLGADTLTLAANTSWDTSSYSSVLTCGFSASKSFMPTPSPWLQTRQRGSRLHPCPFPKCGNLARRRRSSAPTPLAPAGVLNNLASKLTLTHARRRGAF
jgi:hypothetical protein